MASVSGNKTAKGILKVTSSSIAVEEASSKQDVAWDEMNIISTLHPSNKDYGHMKIDEPPTPYNKSSDTEDEEGGGLQRKGSAAHSQVPQLDPSQLATRLLMAGQAPHCSGRSTESDEQESEELIAHRSTFEDKRKKFYKEFQTVHLAKKLIAEEMKAEDEGKDWDDPSSAGRLTSDSDTCTSDDSDINRCKDKVKGNATASDTAV